MAEEKQGKTPPAKTPPRKTTAPTSTAASKQSAGARAKAAPAPAEEAAPKPPKVKRPKAPRPKLAPAHERLAAMAQIVAKPQAMPVKADGRIRVTQLGSPIGREEYQLATLKGLGLNRRHRSRVLEDTPSVRGMIARVEHLLQVEPAS